MKFKYIVKDNKNVITHYESDFDREFYYFSNIEVLVQHLEYWNRAFINKAACFNTNKPFEIYNDGDANPAIALFDDNPSKIEKAMIKLNELSKWPGIING